MSVAAPPAPIRAEPPSAVRIAVAVAVAHALNDMYASFIPPLLPRIMDDLGLSIALAATLSVSYSVATALPQPLFGYLADRYGRRPFAVVGPVVSGLFVAAMGWAEGFGPLVLLLMIAGVGSAAFHPPGASYAVRIDEGKGSGARYSIFSFGGSVGFALGPLVAVGLAQWLGLRGLWVAVVPVLVLAPFLYRALPSGREEIRTAARRPPPTPAQVLRLLRGPLGLIFGVSATMAFIQRMFLTMEPIIVAESGGSETQGALVLTAYLAAQAFGTLTGGLLADRMDRRRLLLQLCAWALPTHLLAVWVGPDGALGLAAAALAGFLGMATLPPIVVMAQEMMPTGTAVGSGIVMGLAWATGSMFVLITGAMADVVGAQTATLASMPVILLAVLFTLHPSLARHTNADTDAARGR